MSTADAVWILEPLLTVVLPCLMLVLVVATYGVTRWLSA